MWTQTLSQQVAPSKQNFLCFIENNKVNYKEELWAVMFSRHGLGPH